MYRTVLEEASSEIHINKSRFIAHIKPIKSEEDAQLFIEGIKKRHNQAAHNVPVYLLGLPYLVERYSDDGEPSGTAGVPVLDMLKKMQVSNVCIVITRYFGGVKLGTGGLVRAYTESAKSVLDQVGLISVDDYIACQLQIDYGHHGKIMNIIANETCFLESTDFTDAVTLNFYASPDTYQRMHEDIVNVTSASAVWLKEDQVKGTLHNQTFIKMEE